MTSEPAPAVFTRSFITAHYVRFAAILLHLLLRTFNGVFWLAAGVHKLRGGWVTSQVLVDIFELRLTELHPESFASQYLEGFAIPGYRFVATVLVVAELYVGVALLLGVTVRPAILVSIFVVFNIGIGGYYDASLLVFYLLAALLYAYPSGHWLGFDRRLHARHPESRWFR